MAIPTNPSLSLSTHSFISVSELSAHTAHASKHHRLIASSDWSSLWTAVTDGAASACIVLNHFIKVIVLFSRRSFIMVHHYITSPMLIPNTIHHSHFWSERLNKCVIALSRVNTIYKDTLHNIYKTVRDTSYNSIFPHQSCPVRFWSKVRSSLAIKINQEKRSEVLLP